MPVPDPSVLQEITILTPIFLLTALVTFFATWWGTQLMERTSAKLGLIVWPNNRSSHSIPTPRGGGAAAALVASCVAAILALAASSSLWPTVGLAAGLAVLGFIDDLKDLKPAIRFGGQTIIIVGFLLSAGDLPVIGLPYSLALGGLGLFCLATFAGVWWINLFNFMDGIDGIAASQTVVTLLSAALLLATTDQQATTDVAFWFSIIIVASAAGFLMRNWPPAKIFMGDAGSYFLAFCIFSVAIQTIASGALSYAAWFILVSAFLTDATVTLLRRVRRGERPWAAHRRHGYQQLSRRWGHRAVTMIFIGLGICWALPMAWLAMAFADLQWPFVALTYVPLIALAIWAGAGAATER